MTILKSKCCGADVMIMQTTETTNPYRCTKCKGFCDAGQQEEKGIDEQKANESLADILMNFRDGSYDLDEAVEKINKVVDAPTKPVVEVEKAPSLCEIDIEVVYPILDRMLNEMKSFGVSEYYCKDIAEAIKNGGAIKLKGKENAI